MGKLFDTSGYRARTEHRLIGVMSGTSLDGIDAVLVSVLTDKNQHLSHVRLEDQFSLPYNGELKALLHKLCIPGSADINDITRAHFGLSHWNARAIKGLIEKGPYDITSIDAVCMHGQTIWHAPEPQAFPGPEGSLEITGTLQISNPSVVASLTGLPVISDFRSADMAEGGQGAPLAPYIDALLFGVKDKAVAVQNIGGIGNVTVLPSGDTTEGVFAFDTGPGNMIIDSLVSMGTGGQKSYDPGGAIAQKGSVHRELLLALMKDPYFSKKPPKSTGREVYGTEFSVAFQRKAQELGLSFEDTIATATAFTAYSIAQAYKDFVIPLIPIQSVIVCGGGAKNKTLLRLLQNYLPPGIGVQTSDELGIPDQAREAMAFALLGHESLMGKPANIPAVTGAKKSVILGTITLGHI